MPCAAHAVAGGHRLRPVPLRRAFLLIGLTLLAVPAAGAARFDFYDRGPYKDGVPRPAEVLGYEPGTYHTSYGNMERYVDQLQHAALDRVTRVPFGRSYEFRERALLVITSPANQQRLAAIRAANARLADPRLLPGEAEAERLIRDTPVTVWLNYSIHGDESASFEAMMQVAYQLAAGEDSLTRAIRDRCVVLLNLAHNPDGHERFVTWINALGSGNPDPLALEQQRQQPWGIGGRTNHYQIDLNRDALAMSQVESREMGAAFRAWRPQVFVDHHGQTASYFFAPPSPPVNPDLSAAEVRKWTEIFGRANATAFDRYGWNYFVRDVFDLYYPGYWDAWPSLQGAVGMTYETDGGGNLAIRRDDETVVTLLDGIERHFTASLATCAAAAANREARLRDFHRFALAAIDEGRRGEVRAYALDPGDDPLRAAELAEDLMATGVEVRWAGKGFRAASARAVWADLPGGAKAAAKAGGKGGTPARFGAREAMAGGPEAAWGSHEFAHGAFVVDLAQPAGRLARTLLERDAPMDTAFARLQLEKYERNVRRGKRAPHEDYDFYDISAWSLPVAYGVAAYALRQAPAGVLLRTPRPEEAEVPADEVPDSLQVAIPVTARRSEPAVLTLEGAKDGAPVLDLHGAIAGGRARTAYVWRSDREGAARLALRLLQEDFKVATSTRPMRAGGREYPRGSFIARVERNPESLHPRIAALARTSGVTVDAVNSAYTESGDTGIGSESITSLKRPRLAVLVDHPVSPTSYGWLWFTLERRIGLRFTALRLDVLPRADLSRYNEIVIPDGAADALAGALGEGGIAKLKDWVSRGGVLVCLDDAAEFPTLKSVGLSSARVVGVKPEKKDAKEEEEEPKDAKADSIAREAERRPEYLPGTVFWVSLDPRHFLGYGYDAPRTPVLLQGRLVLRPSRDGENAAVFEREPLKLSGWSWAETVRRMTGGAYAIDEPNGRGHVVMIAGPATFRLFWRSSERMVLNALLYAPAL